MLACSVFNVLALLACAQLADSRLIYKPAMQHRAGSLTAQLMAGSHRVFDSRLDNSQAQCSVKPPSLSPSVGNSSAESSLMRNTYYPAWTAGYSAQDILWDEYDMVCYFAVVTTPTGIEVPQGQSPIEDFVAEARARGKIPLVSVGGWSGSRYFSSLTADSQRASFVDQLAGFSEQYQIDGIDFDWEYPNANGMGCNQRAPEDSANLLATLRLFRERMGDDFILTADAYVVPYNDASGTPSEDVSAFADVLDYMTPMAYSIYGSWSQTSGPESPLYNCGPVQDSAQSALEAWTAAGFPANKLLMGISGLGAAFQTASSELMPQTYDGVETLLFQQITGNTPQGSFVLDVNAAGALDACGNLLADYGGFWNYQRLIEEGYLNEDGTQALRGFQRYFDGCTGSTFIFSPSDRILVSYSDAQSQSYKIRWMQEHGIGGWSLYDTTCFPQNVYDSIDERLV